jgi:predicted  nucleic acid-binding Zn-ribbon protein
MTLDARQIYTTLRGLENAEEALKKAVADLGAVVAAINDAERKRSQLEKETATISDDQDRIRKNLTSVGQASDIGRRYLDTLRVQEDRIDAIRKELVTLDETIAAKRKEAADIAKRLTL